MAKKRPDSDYTRALAMYDAGMTYREIGEQFGVVTSRAFQMVDRGYEIFKRPGQTSSSRSFPSRVNYGNGDTAWQWRDWNEWTSSPMFPRFNDNSELRLPAWGISWPA